MMLMMMMGQELCFLVYGVVAINTYGPYFPIITSEGVHILFHISCIMVL